MGAVFPLPYREAHLFLSTSRVATNVGMLVIVTDRWDCRLLASGRLRTSVALVFTWFKVLSGVVWVVRARVPQVSGGLQGTSPTSWCALSLHVCQHSKMPLAAALRVMLFSLCACISSWSLSVRSPPLFCVLVSFASP